MSALDEIRKKKNHELDAIERLIIEAWECLDGREWMSDDAAEKLATLEHLAAVARDVNEWLKTIDMGGTGHQRSLESALAELENK